MCTFKEDSPCASMTTARRPDSEPSPPTTHTTLIMMVPSCASCELVGLADAPHHYHNTLRRTKLARAVRHMKRPPVRKREIATMEKEMSHALDATPFRSEPTSLLGLEHPNEHAKGHTRTRLYTLARRPTWTAKVARLTSGVFVRCNGVVSYDNNSCLK